MNEEFEYFEVDLEEFDLEAIIEDDADVDLLFFVVKVEEDEDEEADEA